MVQLHPGLFTNAQVRQLAERLGLNPGDSRFDSSSGHVRLGRQLADHFGLEPEMLWVRIPPELLKNNLSSWSSLECSPACHAGDRGFKSHRGRFHSTVRKLEKRRSSNLRDFVSSNLTRATSTWVVLLAAACKAVVTKQARWTTRGSIPSRLIAASKAGAEASLISL